MPLPTLDDMDTASAHRIVARPAALAGAGLLLALVGCAAPAGSPASSGADSGYSLGSALPAPPRLDVLATGTVVHVDGEARLCPGEDMDSDPAQCVGVPLSGWSWGDIDPDAGSADTRWGPYGMFGTYDGATFALTHPAISLPLFDPIAYPDPVAGTPGAATEEELATIQATITGLLPPEVLITSVAQDGYLIVDVVWDDGTLQQAADTDFGPGVVVIRSALWVVAIE